MNVCLLNDSFPPQIDGVANTVMNYAEILSGMEGYSSIVGTPRYPKTDYSCYPYPVVPYQSFNISNLVEGYRAGNPLASRAIRKLVDFAPDIIHTHCPVMSTVLARVIRAETDAPVVFTYHTKFDEDIAKAVSLSLLQDAAERMLVKNISSCDEVWTVSRGAGENLKALGYEGEYRVVSNGVDFPKGKTTVEETVAAAADYDIPEDLPVFLFVGRIMSYKGIPMIIDALNLLSSAGYDYRMVFIGGGVELDEMIDRVRNYRITVDHPAKDGRIVTDPGEEQKPGRVIFTGPIRDRQVLRAWNTGAHLFLFPSTYDTNGIVVREAAACGLASVLVQGSCAAEGITDGRNGYLIEQTPEAMEEVLKAVCEDPDHAKQVGENAMNEIYLSWESCVRMAAGYYEELIEKKKNGLLPPHKLYISDVPIEAASLLDEAARSIRKASKVIWRAPRTLAEATRDTTKTIATATKDTTKTIAIATKDTTKKIVTSPAALYRGIKGRFSSDGSVLEEIPETEEQSHQDETSL